MGSEHAAAPKIAAAAMRLRHAPESISLVSVLLNRRMHAFISRRPVLGALRKKRGARTRASEAIPRGLLNVTQRAQTFERVRRMFGLRPRPLRRAA